MPRGLRKKTKQYVLDRFQDEDPEGYFKYKTKSVHGLTEDQLDFIQDVESQSVQKIRSMLNRGVDPNFFLLRTKQTPLHIAVENKGGSDAACEKILGVMLFFGADPNAQDSKGYSPLHTACICGNTLALELLLQAGADVNLLDNRHETPLMTMCRHLCDHSSHFVDLLIARGAVVSYRNDDDQSVLHILTAGQLHNSEPMWSIRDRHHIVETILKQGLCANVTDHKGVSPLCYEISLLLQARQPPPTLASHMLKTAKVLVCGGAVLQIQQNDLFALQSVLAKAVRISQALDLSHLVPLIKDLHPIISRKYLQLSLQLLPSVSRLTNTRNLEKELETSLSIVPSLAQLSKLCLRQSLGGTIMVSTDRLPLPDKVKSYIRSCD